MSFYTSSSESPASSSDEDTPVSPTASEEDEYMRTGIEVVERIVRASEALRTRVLSENCSIGEDELNRLYSILDQLDFELSPTPERLPAASRPPTDQRAFLPSFTRRYEGLPLGLMPLFQQRLDHSQDHFTPFDPSSSNGPTYPVNFNASVHPQSHERSMHLFAVQFPSLLPMPAFLPQQSYTSSSRYHEEQQCAPTTQRHSASQQTQDPR